VSLPEVKEIQRWTLRPGDRLIVSTDQQITNDQVDRIKDIVRASLALPDDFPVLVTGPGINVEVATS
jgi:hypothetical protein